MKVEYESDYRSKLLIVHFPETVELRSSKDVAEWRASWTKALSNWHSPYKALVDCTNLVYIDPTCVGALESMFRFLERFFLRKVKGFTEESSSMHEHLPFDVVDSRENALKDLGVRSASLSKKGDFRSLIQFDNHFEQQVIELHTLAPVVFDAEEKVSVLKSKLMNNLMQWHSSWNLIIDCSQLEIEPQVFEEFGKMFRFLKRFFLEDVVGYGNVRNKENYPFPIYRARHRAAESLKKESSVSGRDANCSTRK